MSLPLSLLYLLSVHLFSCLSVCLCVCLSVCGLCLLSSSYNYLQGICWDTLNRLQTDFQIMGMSCVPKSVSKFSNDDQCCYYCYSCFPQYIFLFQMPKLPEFVLSLNDFEAIDYIFSKMYLVSWTNISPHFAPLLYTCWCGGVWYFPVCIGWVKIIVMFVCLQIHNWLIRYLGLVDDGD